METPGQVSFGIGAVGMAAFVLSLVSVRPMHDKGTESWRMAGRPSFHIEACPPFLCVGWLS
jgi:hypothetical protein